MPRIMFLFPLIVSAFVMFSAGPASASCAEDIAKAEKVRRDSPSDPRALNAVDRILEGARKALAAGQEKKCRNMVKTALSKL